MDLYEYQARELFREHGVPVLGGAVATTPEQAREAAAKDLDALRLLERTEEIKHSVGHCQRCGTTVEPYLSEQWFVRTKPLAERGVQAVKDGRITWTPEQWEKTYFHWMENIRDWCISRQLWWGHRIPAWTCADCRHVTVAETDPAECEKCGSRNIAQDENMLSPRSASRRPPPGHSRR